VKNRREKKIGKIEKLKKLFLKELPENPIDGTKFDINILNNLEKLQKKYKNILRK